MATDPTIVKAVVLAMNVAIVVYLVRARHPAGSATLRVIALR